MDCVIHIFRSTDLRLLDNRALAKAFKSRKPVLLVACIDHDLKYSRKEFYLPAGGALRRKFHADCITDLGNSLKQLMLENASNSLSIAKENDNNSVSSAKNQKDDISSNKDKNGEESDNKMSREENKSSPVDKLSMSSNIPDSSESPSKNITNIFDTKHFDNPLNVYFGSATQFCTKVFSKESACTGTAAHFRTISKNGDIQNKENDRTNDSNKESQTGTKTITTPTKLNFTEVFLSREYGTYEQEEEDQLHELCGNANIKLTIIDDTTMVSREKLAAQYPKKRFLETKFVLFPDNFMTFKSLIERKLKDNDNKNISDNNNYNNNTKNISTADSHPSASQFISLYCGEIEESVFTRNPGKTTVKLTSNGRKFSRVVLDFFCTNITDSTSEKVINNDKKSDGLIFADFQINSNLTKNNSLTNPTSNNSIISTATAETSLSSATSASQDVKTSHKVIVKDNEQNDNNLVPYRSLCAVALSPAADSAFNCLVDEAKSLHIADEVRNVERFDVKSTILCSTHTKSTAKSPNPSGHNTPTKSSSDKLSFSTDDLPFVGGEMNALKRLNKVVWGENTGTSKKRLNQGYTPLASQKDTRTKSFGDTYTSKFSMYLALGNFSAKQVCYEVALFEKVFYRNESTYWLIFELLWRDFWKFAFEKHGHTFYTFGGMQKKPNSWWVGERKVNNNDEESRKLFLALVQGQTGLPYIDAHMRELVTTGFMSNRGRQNIASFLVHDLKLDWRIGAELMEHFLLDHDCLSNGGNWQSIAGIGCQGGIRENKFNIIKQSLLHEKNGAFIKFWCPELEAIPGTMVHTPWVWFQENQQKIAENKLKFWVPKIYTNPIVSTSLYQKKKVVVDEKALL